MVAHQRCALAAGLTVSRGPHYVGLARLAKLGTITDTATAATATADATATATADADADANTRHTTANARTAANATAVADAERTGATGAIDGGGRPWEVVQR